MTEIKERIIELISAMKTDTKAYMYSDVYWDVEYLMEELLKEYVIVSKETIGKKAQTSISEPFKKTIPELKCMRTELLIGCKSDYDNRVCESFVRNRQIESLCRELERE